MEPLLVEATSQSPKIVMNKDEGVFSVEGRSYPENVMAVYQPMFDWFTEYVKDPNQETKLVIKLGYHNTASTKVILSLLHGLAKMQTKGHKVLISWVYGKDDEESLEAGEDVSKVLDVPFEFVSY